ncbi:hypothetical protein [Amycolatopsis sp. lyj-346]|uniref:hypothetical protein n=1 Tax=Amycolatopsis sp. lyj-346 TaxID=2789289 RepID=UPI00397CE0DD
MNKYPPGVQRPAHPDFWPGQLWLAWLHSGEEQFKTLALASAEKLAPRRTDTGTHDLGFLFSPS